MIPGRFQDWGLNNLIAEQQTKSNLSDPGGDPNTGEMENSHCQSYGLDGA